MSQLVSTKWGHTSHNLIKAIKLKLRHWERSIRHKFRGLPSPEMINSVMGQSIVTDIRHEASTREVYALLGERFTSLSPLPVYYAPGLPRRLTMVTDSINAGSLFGGVGTALILSALLAERIGASLRIVTRTERPDSGNVKRLFDTHGLKWKQNITFIFADARNGSHYIDVGDSELFLTTSWWTTQSVRRSVPPDQIIYLLQEDERMFYPMGDDHLRCTETLSDPKIRFVVNSKALKEHLVKDGFTNIQANAISFEPAFPEKMFYWEERESRTRMQFLYYARPKNFRNLYFRGLEAIAAAIESGDLVPSEWDFTFVGRDLHQILLPCGIKPNLRQNLDWGEYASIARRTDLCLSLMYTPHTSYPPLDLAACGAAVVTNRAGSKRNLERYSENILCVDPNVDDLSEALGRAARLAKDVCQRRLNYERHSIVRDWKSTIDPCLDYLTRC